MVLYDAEAQKEKMRPGVGLVTRNPGNGLRWGPPEEALGFRNENQPKARGKQGKASKPRVRVDFDDKRDRGAVSGGAPKTPNYKGAARNPKTPSGGSPTGGSSARRVQSWGSQSSGSCTTPGKSPPKQMWLSSSPLPVSEDDPVPSIDAATQTFDEERIQNLPISRRIEDDHEVFDLVRSGKLERALELLDLRGDASAAWQRQRVKMLQTRSVEQSFATSHAWPLRGRTSDAASTRAARVATADAPPFHPSALMDAEEAASRLMREFATLAGLDDPRFRKLVQP